MTSRQEIEDRINAICNRIGLEVSRTLPRVSDGMATPHVEGEAVPFDYVVAERGQELLRESNLDADDLAYLVIRDRILSYVLRLEAETRAGRGYSRKSWMDALVTMMTRADLAWGRRAAREYEDILRSDLSEEERRATRPLPLPQVD